MTYDAWLTCHLVSCDTLRTPGAVYLLQLAFIAIAVVAWWGKALLHIPPHFTWPFSKLLAFPHASNYLEVGAVTVLPWVAMCDRFSNLLARVVFPERVSPCFSILCINDSIHPVRHAVYCLEQQWLALSPSISSDDKGWGDGVFVCVPLAFPADAGLADDAFVASAGRARTAAINSETAYQQASAAL